MWNKIAELTNEHGYMSGVDRESDRVKATGKGLHYRLDEMTGNSIEVVNYSKISRRIDNDQVFFNKMRVACGIDPIDVTLGQKDGEAVWVENFS